MYLCGFDGVTEIQPAKTESFEEAKPKLQAELARDAADSQIGKLINKVDDALARGDDLGKVASDMQLKVVKAEVDQAGHANAIGDDGAPLRLTLQLDPDVVRTAFGTEAGQVSNVTETQDGGFYVVRINKVTPSVVRPLAEVHDQVLAAWQREQRFQHVTKTAKEIVDAINAGKPLKQVAAERKLTVTTTPQLERGVAPGNLPPQVVGALFRAKLHQAVQGPSSDGITVAELTEVIPADPSADKPKVDSIGAQIQQQIQRDVFAEYAGALRRYFPVEIDQSRLEKVF